MAPSAPATEAQSSALLPRTKPRTSPAAANRSAMMTNGSGMATCSSRPGLTSSMPRPVASCTPVNVASSPSHETVMQGNRQNTKMTPKTGGDIHRSLSRCVPPSAGPASRSTSVCDWVPVSDCISLASRAQGGALRGRGVDGIAPNSGVATPWLILGTSEGPAAAVDVISDRTDAEGRPWLRSGRGDLDAGSGTAPRLEDLFWGDSHAHGTFLSRSIHPLTGYESAGGEDDGRQQAPGAGGQVGSSSRPGEGVVGRTDR